MFIYFLLLSLLLSPPPFPLPSFSASSPSLSFSNVSHDTIAEIFGKIGSKETNREGLNDLYDMKAANPGIDLEPFLVNSTAFFKNFIENGLKSIEAERRGGSSMTSSTNSTSTPHSRSLEQLQQQQSASRSGSSQSLVDGLAASSSSNGSSTMTTPDFEGGGGGSNSANPTFYMERLKVLRAKCGLDNPRVPPMGVGGTTVSSSTTDDNDSGFDKMRSGGSSSSPSFNLDGRNEAPRYGTGGGTISLGTSHKIVNSRPIVDTEMFGDMTTTAAVNNNDNGGKDVEDLKRRLEMIKSKRKM